MTGLYIIGGTVAFVLGAVIWLGYSARRDGRAAQVADDSRKALSDAESARKADGEVAGMSEPAVADRLSKWNRD